MGSRKTTERVETTMRPRSAQEQQMLNLLSQFAQQSGGQLDMRALGQLASGQGLQSTPEDQRLVEQAFTSTSDIAKRSLEDFVRAGNLGLDETLSARGVQGSSIEGIERGMLNRDATRQLATMLDQARGQSAQALMQMPFQRAGVQLSANQQLFNQLLQGASGASQFGLQERIADIDTIGKTKTPFSFGEALDIGQGIAKTAVPGGMG